MKGGVRTPWYRLYDRLRRGVNTKLVAYLGRYLEATSANMTTSDKTRILEAGSGPGFASSLFAQRADVTLAACLDIDYQALREARRRDPFLPVVVGDIRRMPFVDGAFTVVFNSSTVEHLDCPVDALREMHRVCHPAGRVFVGVPYLWGPLCLQPLIARTPVGQWLGQVFSKPSLDRLLVAAGLIPTGHVYYFLNFFVGAISVKQHFANNSSAPTEKPC